MLSLLVVDDEMIIADGLYQMLQDAFADQLLVRRCYSSHEARHILEENRIDILMTDIEMPDGSGLELHSWVSHRWPMMRIIYLTGYSDFDYARRALDQRALAYVLKSEGDPAIVDAVNKAISAIREETESLLRLSHTSSNRSGRIHQLIYHALHGGHVTPAQFQLAMSEQAIPFSTEKPVLVGYCYGEDPSFQPLQAITLIEQLTDSSMSLLLTEMTSRAFLLLCQADTPNQIPLLRGTLENAQRILEKQNDLMTVCLMEDPTDWDRLAEAGETILDQVNRTSPGTGELLLIRRAESSPAAQIPSLGEAWADKLAALRRMNEYLLTGQRDLYFDEEKQLLSADDCQHNRRQIRAINTSLSMSLLHSAGTLPQNPEIQSLCDRLRDTHARPDTDVVSAELHQLADLLFESRGRNKNDRQRQLITRVNEYIATHLEGDLSLITIAEAVHFHPVYLSRIYKEHAGLSLSDHIANQRFETACHLLRTSQQQISAIARSTGFTSSNYFSRWFRKRVGLTPQEYRDKALNSK